MLVERVTNNLSSESIFTQKYGCLSKEDATTNAKKIEDSAYLKADEHYQKEPDGDGSAAVQLYAKECSKLILEVLKKGPQVKVNGEVEKEVTEPKETFFDISKGQRSFIEVDEVEELLKPLMEPGNCYTKICFSNRSFGLGAARAAKPILESLKSRLQEADLSDFVAGRPEAEALEVMNLFSAALEGCILRSLNLSDNALGEKGIRAFEKLFKSQCSLEELYLMNDGISEEAAQAVCELIPSTDKLKVLKFHNNMTGDEGAIAISEIVKRSPLLEDFRCSSTRVGSEGGSALCEALGSRKYMKKLDLRDNMYGVEAGLVLSKALSKHSNLKELYLSYLNLEDEGVIAISNALKESAPSLEVLEMAGNEITIEAVPCLAACIVEKKLLNKLNLSENELKDEGVIQLCEALEDGHEGLKEVDMSSNSITRAGARVLARAVVKLPKFKLLNLNGNYISDEGVDDLKIIFKKSPDMLGSLDENDPEGGDDDDVDDDNDEKESGVEELGSKLKNLAVNSDED